LTFTVLDPPNPPHPTPPATAASARIETISWRPRAYIFHNFLSQEEANHVVKLVESKVTRVG